LLITMDKVLSINDLNIKLHTNCGTIHAVRGINLDIEKGEIHGIVGESGCGKTVSAKAILRLHNDLSTNYSGEIKYDSKSDILKMTNKELKNLRGKYISLIFQDPVQSLNPLLKIGGQITETIRAHSKLNSQETYLKAVSLMEDVGIHPAEKRFNQFPFELSGGMLQRVMIATAISSDPKLLVADEPTTALDVTMQAKILDLFKEIRDKTGMSILLITHNFGVVAEICDRVSVMYAGQIVESGEVKDIFRRPAHPYTKALIESIPKAKQTGKRMIAIPGSPPELSCEIKGCAFAPRCEYAEEKCFDESPREYEISDNHINLCHLKK